MSEPVPDLLTGDLPSEQVRRRERDGPRWVVGDTRSVLPALLRADVRVARAHDLRLCHAILAQSAWAALETEIEGWWPPPGPAMTEEQLFDTTSGVAVAPDQLRSEYESQRTAIAGSTHPGRLRLLCAAESAGALVAAEIGHHGLPWSRAVHDRLLTESLGPRPSAGGRPARLAALVDRIRVELQAPMLNPDSQPHLLQALKNRGLPVTSTRQWELERIEHPVIEPLLEYRKGYRLLTANGWNWLDQWVRPGVGGQDRFHPDYVVGGVVTGRWATDGGGALQLPKQLRAAIVADPGWRLVVADAAQLEPRVLAAMSGDPQMAGAARGADLYQGLVDSGVLATRDLAKVAMLGALYGATTGESGALLPRLMKAYPRAMAVVEDAARVGEQGGRVLTWLGRTSPRPTGDWVGSAEPAHRTSARDWGRFTRNFVVQGTAAEWALCWLADLRARLHALAPERPAAEQPRIVYFLHDEVIVHAPQELGEQAAAAVLAAAEAAGRLLFGDGPVEFPLELAVVDDYASA